MIKTYLLLLLVFIPMIVSGINHNIYPDAFSFNDDTAFQHNNCANAIPPISPSRGWRIAEIRNWHNQYNYITQNKTLYYYSQSQPTAIDSSLFFRYIDTSESWERFSSIKYYYNDGGQYINRTENYGYLDTYHLDQIITGVYNAQNRLTDRYEYQGDIGNPRYHFFYDNNVLSEFYTYYITEDVINPYTKYVMTNDEQGRCIMVSYFESLDSLNWSLVQRNLISYHPNDTMTGEQYSENLALSFYGGFHERIPYSVYSGMITETLMQCKFDDVWYSVGRYVSEYDENNRMIFFRNQTGFNGNWTDYNVDSVSYDINGNLCQISTHARIGDTFGEGYWITNYIWEQTTANEDNVINPITLNLTVYPNPFKDNVNISFHHKGIAPVESAIYNIKGQLIKALGTSKTNSLNWDGKDKEGRAVSNGIYFVKAIQDGKTVTSKIIRIKY